jgi:stromal membrane-associated protein
MGTHISRVKSVDLDSWTDEQLQSVLKWGNSRANKYWEAKLTAGHVPSEAKIENFIRTKYESKRWAMDGPMPDPATLEGDDEVPLAVVQEKAKLERSASNRVPPTSAQFVPRTRQPQPQIDLFSDDDVVTPPARPSTTGPPVGARPPPQSTAALQAPAKQTRPGDSLLGLDFFGTNQGATSAVSNSASTTAASRPDLKQSILSLYASAPKPQPTQQHERSGSFGTLVSSQSQSSDFGGLTDAFSGLTFPATTPHLPQKSQEKASPFSGLTNFTNAKSPPAAPQVTSSTAGGGRLLDGFPTASKPPTQQPALHKPPVSSNGLDFSFTKNATPASPATSRPAPFAPASSNDLFDLAPSVTSAATTSKFSSNTFVDSSFTVPPAPKPASPPSVTSAFNLSAAPVTAPTPRPTATSSTSNVTSGLFSNNIDPWGSNAWSTPDPSPASVPAPAPAPARIPHQSSASMAMRVPDTLTANDIGAGWGAPASKPTPTVAPDEDFGGWTSAAPSITTTSTTKQNSSSGGNTAGGFGGNDDLFSNVWE